MAKRKTDEQFKQEVENLVGGEYEFLDTYINAKTKIRVKHNKCGHIYKVKPSHFLDGTRCPYCNGNHKKTDAEFKDEVYSLVGNEYEFIDPYQGAFTKTRVKHNKCGKVYKVQPSNFLIGERCPQCATKAHIKTDTQFKKEVKNLVGDEYKFLDSYQDSHAKLRVKHAKCGNIYEVQPYAFLNGRRCPYCSANANKTDVRFKKEVFDLVGGEYTFLDQYINSQTKIQVKHNKCGHIYKVKPNNFLRGYRCPYCNGNAKKTDNQFKREVYALVGSDYIFLDEYVANKIKLRVKHKKCNNVYKVTPSDFLTGYRCPFCNSPKGEVAINKILKSLGIKYEYQKTFNDLRDTQPLSYDFYIPSQAILIEYQGIQHYEPVDYFGGEAQFKLQQKHDKLKSDYAKKHGYNLIAIPYTEDTFSKIKKYLVKHGLKK